MRHQIEERLAALHIDIGETAAERHLVAVAAELRDPAQAARHLRTRRIKVGTLVAAALLILFPGAALAAEGAVPGDLLYPVKLAAERVLLLVDPHIEAEHRIEEVEMLVDRAVPLEEVSDRLIDADRSVQDRDVPVDLLDRLDVVRDRVATDYGQRQDAPASDEGGDDVPDSGRPEDDVRSDEPRPPTASTSTTTSTTTTPPVSDRPPPQDSTTTAPPRDGRPVTDAATTTVPSRDQDGPARDG